MKLTKEQVNDLAKPFVDTLRTLTEFFNEPVNQEAYSKWYREKYGHTLDNAKANI